jgi:LPXTG-motif cell wall-anchored protein
MRRTISLLTVVAVMAVMISLASPVWAQGSSGPNYGPNGPYYGPYDYCGWSPYACLYTPRAPASSTASPPSTPPAPAVVRQLPATGGLDAIPFLGLGGGALLVAGGLLARRIIR